MRKYALLTFLVHLALLGAFSSQSILADESLSRSHSVADASSLSTTLTALADVDLSDFKVTPLDSTVGSSSLYELTFRISKCTYIALKNGGFMFAFPDGFLLSQITQVEYSDDPHKSLTVEDFDTAAQLLTVLLDKEDESTDSLATDVIDTLECDTTAIQIKVLIKAIGNPFHSDSYYLSVTAFKQNHFVVAGPAVSEVFAVVPSVLDTVVVSPGKDTTVRAGEWIQCLAEGYDEYGNEIEDLVYTWSLGACVDCIGYLDGSALRTTTVGQGRIFATSSGITGESGLLTVAPGDLHRMSLFVSDTQFVGHPLVSAAAIALYDEYNNLKTDYDLTEEPITLSVGTGSLEGAVVNDNSLQIGGVVHLLSADIKYHGLTSTTGLVADNGNVTSNTVEVSFNGYDVLDALDVQRATISRVFAGHQTSAFVPVQNSGNINPSQLSVIRSYYTSGTSVNETVFDPHPFGEVDTVEVLLPVLPDVSESDTLVIELEAGFDLDGITITTLDTQLFPVSVLEPSIFGLVEGSFEPGIIASGLAFDIAFDVFAEGFAQPIDSVNLTIQLVMSEGLESLLYSGSPSYDSYVSGVISYTDLPGGLDANAQGTNGWHSVRVDYRLYSAGNVFTLENSLTDSVYVIFDPGLSYIDGSITPLETYAGTHAAFSFDVDLTSEFQYEYDAESSTFAVSGGSFSSSTNLVLDGEALSPGINGFSSEGIFIPLSQLDRTLKASANIRYIIPGVPDTLTFTTTFGDLQVPVLASPLSQIVAVDVVAPNKPKVNTLQSFQVSCKVANLSETPLDSLSLKLTSDGYSTFEPTMIVESIAAFDTAEVFFDVSAHSQPTSAEIFRVDIVSPEVDQAPPIDNIALITIETPAVLELTYTVLGAEDNIVSFGNRFDLIVELVNSGMGAVSGGSFVMTVDGLSARKDTITGSINADEHVEFPFEAPHTDTTVKLHFVLTQIPYDLNSNQPIIMADTSFDLSIRIVSAEATLFIEAASLGANLALPGRQKELFALDITNTGISSVAAFKIEKIELLVKDRRGIDIDVRSILNTGNTGFYENGRKVSATVAADNRLVLTFDNYVILPQVKKSLVMVVEFKQTDESSVYFELTRDGVTAEFIEGPFAGQSPQIGSSAEGESLYTQGVAMKSSSLDGSFMVETNPFNPEDPEMSPVRFSYELSEDSPVEFRIFSVTGEEVYSADFARGAEGGTAGENMVEWDGRNDSGHIVVNGVYVASMRNVSTGESARIKIAVVK